MYVRPLFTIALLSSFYLPLVADAEAPRYHWQADQQFVYEVEITADLPTKTETLKGHITYQVKSAQAPRKIVYRGGLKKQTKTKPGKSPRRSGSPFGPGFFPSPIARSPFARTVNPFKGLQQTSNEITITEQGSVLTIVGSSQLPYLLGNLSLLVFEPLPETDDPSWSVDKGVLIREKKEQSGRGFGPFGDPFFARRFGGDKPEKTSSAGVSMTFTKQMEDDDLVTYKKAYRLHSPGDDMTLTVEGKGDWTFNRKLGMSESLALKQRLTINQDNVSIVLPFDIKYRRLSDKEWAKIEADRLAAEKARQEEIKRIAAEAKAKADAPIEGDQREQVLADLGGGELNKLKTTLKLLAGKTPRDDEQLASAIQPHTSHESAAVGSIAKKALAAFSPDYKQIHDLNALYKSRNEVKELGLWVSYDTPLPAGLIVAANRSHRERSHYPAEVVAVLSNGLVKVNYVGWGGRTEERLREDIFLAPLEVEQPKLNEQQLAALKTHHELVRKSLGSTEQAAETEALIRSYRDSKEPLAKTGAALPAGAKLPKFLVVAAKKKDQKWYQAHVSSELADGRVAVRFSGDVWDAKVSRESLRLPPAEVKPPNLPPIVHRGATLAFRTWKDKTGVFSVDAKFLTLEDGFVKLERQVDGKVLKAPFSGLSDEDRKYVEDLTTTKTKNPFQPASP